MNPIRITKTTHSQIEHVNFNQLTFGETPTDHMLVCDCVNGVWQAPEIVPYAPITLDPSAKVFHYGQAIFEGMKAYKDEDGELWLFRPHDNFTRFNRSAERMAMAQVPESVFIEGLHQLLALEQNWVKQGDNHALYIRPFLIATSAGVSAAPSQNYRFMIILSPVQNYYSGDVKVQIANHYSRAANGGVGAAKTAGNYAAQFYPTQLANQAGYQQVVWTDDATHTWLEEAGTMNLFFRLGDTLVTSPISDRILDGITRKSLLDLAKYLNIPCEVRPISVTELVASAKNGQLKEAFGSGTAAVISPICAFAHEGVEYAIAKQSDSYGEKLGNALKSIQRKHQPDPFNWTVKVAM